MKVSSIIKQLPHLLLALAFERLLNLSELRRPLWHLKTSQQALDNLAHQLKGVLYLVKAGPVDSALVGGVAYVDKRWISFID